jgi:transcriptional regulator with XRE-family HTH domain
VPHWEWPRSAPWVGGLRSCTLALTVRLCNGPRSTKGLTHHQLARMVHLRAGERILAWERGAVEPNPRILLALAQALTVEPMQLLLLPHGVDLQALRLASGRSPADMAQSVHVSLPSYLEWETGRSLPLDNDRILSALSRTLRCSSNQIVGALSNCAASESREPVQQQASPAVEVDVTG